MKQHNLRQFNLLNVKQCTEPPSNIQHILNGTKNKILNNLHYNKTFTFLEDHYFQEHLEQFQTPFTVYQLNKMYTGYFYF